MAGNISEVSVNQYLCTGCGTCVGICKTRAIKMKEDCELGIWLPEVNEARCNHCGLCLKVCPGPEVDFQYLNCKIFNTKPRDVLLNNFISCYVGNSKNTEIRYNSSSGGLVTSLLIFALRKGMIDGAIVTKMDNKTLRPQVVVARTPRELIRASKSKYFPVPVNVLLNHVLSQEGKFALVGLPCHIHGVRMAEDVFPEIRRKIVLLFGLFCSHNVTFRGTQYFLEQLGVKSEDLSVFHYRDGGWPGKPIAILKDQKVVSDKGDAWRKMFAARFFTPMRCMFCVDATSELADISFGDPWLPRFRDEKWGKSIVIPRTEKGSQLLELAASQGAVSLDSISAAEVRQSQGSLRYKKRIVMAMTRLFYGRSVQNVPRYNYNRQSPTAADYLLSMMFLMNAKISAKPWSWSLLERWSMAIDLMKKLRANHVPRV